MLTKTVTAKKLAANRSNASKSTGPKSEKGKAHSRRNALKHGILATTLLVTEGGDEQEVAGFNSLLETLTRDFAPRAGLEELWLAKTAMCWWRQRLALKSELGLGPKAFRDATPWDFSDLEKVDLQERRALLLGDQFDRVLRYGRSIQRELLYCLDQLQKLQRARNRTEPPGAMKKAPADR